MPKRIKLRSKALLIVVFVAIVSILIYYYPVGFPSFNKNNAVSIFGSVIQGMSALLSVAIAITIFRIQTLENRTQSIEESALNFIFQITSFTYPQWSSSVEDDITSGRLTNQYYNRRKAKLWTMEILEPAKYQEILKEYAEDRDTQQERLMDIMKRRKNVSQTIRRIKDGFYPSVVFLIMPIVVSLLMFMVSDILDSFWNFIMVSAVVLMSALGTALLTRIVLESTVE